MPEGETAGEFVEVIEVAEAGFIDPVDIEFELDEFRICFVEEDIEGALIL